LASVEFSFKETFVLSEEISLILRGNKILAGEED
jgi:hypothetical protein